MNEIMLIIVGIAGIVLGYGLARRKIGAVSKQSKAKAENKEKVLAFVREKGEIKNDAVETLLGVSDATAERYLNELEKEGEIIQHGTIGQGVFYTPK